MSELVSSQLDERLRAVVIGRRTLRYAEGADAAVDRPAHVRAGSGVVQLGADLWVVQDDSNFLARIAPDGRVEALPLPAVDGVRQFDTTRGNKKAKLDLESGVAWDGPEGPELWVFGSGSSPGRDRVVRVTWANGQPCVRMVALPRVYQRLSAWRAFSGSELNLEGAVLREGRLTLFQRGNGAAIDAYEALNSSIEVEWSAWVEHFEHPESACPMFGALRRYDLGTVDGVRLSFTDATSVGPHIAYLAAAEDSPNTYDDGPTVGVALGFLSPSGARWARVEDPEAASGWLTAKAEGLVIERDAPARAMVVVDRDDPAAPCELLELRLDGPWWDADRA